MVYTQNSNVYFQYIYWHRNHVYHNFILGTNDELRGLNLLDQLIEDGSLEILGFVVRNYTTSTPSIGNEKNLVSKRKIPHNNGI